MAGASLAGRRSHFSAEDQEILIKHLNELLESKAFAGSRRSKCFLRYVVEETLAGRGPEIKERNIAVDLFSRNNDFDPQSDSIVRVSASEVRKRLDWAYEVGLGQSVRIELPVGSYQPVFHCENFPAPIPANSILVAPAYAGAISTKRWKYVAALAGIGIAGIVLAGMLWNQHSSRTASSLDVVWQPFCKKDSPVLISLPAPTVLELKNPGEQFSLRMRSEIPSSEVRWQTNYFVGTGAALGAARFAEQLAWRHQAFFIKFGSDVSFSDLNRSPAILIGSYTSPLTMEIAKKLHFRFQISSDQCCIVDSMRPSRRWCTQRAKAAEPAEGYALVCRLLNSDSGHPILIVAGLEARDTQAAVEFLSNQSYFDLFARSAPRDWPHRNFELVLHNSIHGAVPGAPTIVDSYIERREPTTNSGSVTEHSKRF